MAESINVTLTSSDNKTFTIKRKSALLSSAIKAIIADPEKCGEDAVNEAYINIP